MRRFLKSLSIKELLIIAAMAALGIAIKPVVSSLTHILTGPLGIPGGAISGGLYMLWLAVAVGLTHRPVAAFLAALTQAVIVITTGMYGSHGAMTLFSYTLPGLLCTLVFLCSKERRFNSLHYLLGCMAANVAGSYASNLLFFSLPLIPLLLSLSAAALSGAVGGVIACNLVRFMEALAIKSIKKE